MEAGALPRPGRAFAPRSRRLLGALSEERLVEYVRRGNDVAFEVLYDRHSRAILSFCRHMLGTPEEAEDAVQHTFIAAYNDLLTSDRPIKLKAWLYTIARNRCLSVLRARRESPVETIEVSTAGLAEQVQERQDLLELLGDLRRLPDEQRAALVLAEIGDLPHSDIAEVLGVEPSKVKSLVFQARSNLIELRDARAIPCAEIREQLSTLSGGALRRGPLRKHLKTCDGCREFRVEVNRQRAAMAAVLPVLPTLGLKHSALAAIGGGVGGGGAAAAGGAAAGGGLLSGAGSAGLAAKAVVVLAVSGAAVGGGVAITHDASGPPSSPPGSVEQGTAHRSPVAAQHAQGPPGSTPAAPGVQALTAHVPRGVARRVRAHGSPAKKHQGQTTSPGLAIGHSHTPPAKGHSQTHTPATSQGNHGANGNSSAGGKKSHTTTSHGGSGGNGGQSTSNGHQGTPQGQAHGQTTPATPTITTPSLPDPHGLKAHVNNTHVPPSHGTAAP
jgi:RNA polymerase sigma factor (sigma-70 family)